MNDTLKTILSAVKQCIESGLKKSVPDWNESDSDSINYIKNKTHYEETKKIELFNSREFLGIESQENVSISSNATYKVICNDVTYECSPYNISLNFEDYVAIGNSLLAGDESGLGDNEPFFIAYSAASNDGFIAFETLDTSHVVSLYSIIDGVETTIWDNLEFDTQNWHAYNNDNLINDIAITKAGEKYNVIVNGQAYEFISKYDSDNASYYLGLYWNDSATSDIPFGIYTWNNEETLLCSKEYGYYDIEVTKSQTVTHKIDEKYLPAFSKVGKSGTGKNSEIFNDYSNNVASGINSHAEGYRTTASGDSSHAEGCRTTASGNYSHAEGSGTTASGNYSHAEGSGTTASGNYSHAEGSGTTASGRYQHVQGTYNINDVDVDGNALNTYVHIVGNGTPFTRSNAHTLDWSGNAWYAGSVEGTALILSSPNGTRFNITIGDDGVLTASEIVES